MPISIWHARRQIYLSEFFNTFLAIRLHFQDFYHNAPRDLSENMLVSGIEFIQYIKNNKAQYFLMLAIDPLEVNLAKCLPSFPGNIGFLRRCPLDIPLFETTSHYSSIIVKHRNKSPTEKFNLYFSNGLVLFENITSYETRQA